MQVAYQLGNLHESAGRTREAAAEYEKALASDPDGGARAEIQYRLGQCREKLGDGPGALKAYEQAMASRPAADPFRLSAVARLASMHEERGRVENALTCYRDIAKNSADAELAAAAKGRIAELGGAKPAGKARRAAAGKRGTAD